MGTRAINAEASQSRGMPAPQAICFWGVLARRRATLRGFSAVFLWFYTFQKWHFWRKDVWHMNNYCHDLMKGRVDLRFSNKTLISFTKFQYTSKWQSRLQKPLKTENVYIRLYPFIHIHVFIYTHICVYACRSMFMYVYRWMDRWIDGYVHTT